MLGALGYWVLAWSLVGRPMQGLEGASQFIECRTRMISQAAGPRLFLVGGSSVGNGISARAIQDAAGIPTYNYSFWVPLGPEFILDRTKGVLRRGDTVLLTLEYEMFDWDGNSPYWLDKNSMLMIASREREFLLSRPLLEQVHFLLRLSDTMIMNLLWRSSAPPPEAQQTEFKMENWNSNGDEIGNTTARKRQEISGNVWLGPLPCLIKGYSSTPKGFPIVESFVKWAQANGIRVLATYPNLARHPAYSAPAVVEAFATIHAFYGKLGVPVLGTASEAMVPAEECFDTPYHLTYEFIKPRTGRLLHDLMPELSGHPVIKPGEQKSRPITVF